MKKLLIPAIAILTLSQNVFAGTGVTNPVQIENISIIGVAFGGHLAGNMEIKVKNGFTLPAGVACDTVYITTKKAVDSDRSMFSLLKDSRNFQRPVQLQITDNPTNTAYSGRCSLVAVSLF